MSGVSVQTREARAGLLTDPQTKGISRREFMNYLWGASGALLLAEAGAAALWFALPHYKRNVDYFEIDPRTIPPSGAPPIYSVEADFWLSQTADGLLALVAQCPRDSIRYKWVQPNHRFECPACGSKFTRDGRKIRTGPPSRGPDRYVITATTPNGTFSTPADGGPVLVQGATAISVNVREKILGKQPVFDAAFG